MNESRTLRFTVREVIDHEFDATVSPETLEMLLGIHRRHAPDAVGGLHEFVAELLPPPAETARDRRVTEARFGEPEPVADIGELDKPGVSARRLVAEAGCLHPEAWAHFEELYEEFQSLPREEQIRMLKDARIPFAPSEDH